MSETASERAERKELETHMERLRSENEVRREIESLRRENAQLRRPPTMQATHVRARGVAAAARAPRTRC